MPAGTDIARAEFTRDGILDGRLSLLQPGEGPRVAIDAIFLAAAVPARSGAVQSALEAGAATGAASLALAWRVHDLRVTGIELQPELKRMADENARLNGLDQRVKFVEADILDPMRRLREAGPGRESFDHVFANPPYDVEGRSRAPRARSKRLAHQGDEDTGEHWIRFLTAMARPRGTLTMIQRASELPALLHLLERRFGGLVIFPLFPTEGRPASRVLIQGIKGSRAPPSLRRGLVLHGPEGGYTDAAEAILRHGEALRL